jgi:hypothetical protein
MNSTTTAGENAYVGEMTRKLQGKPKVQMHLEGE